MRHLSNFNSFLGNISESIGAHLPMPTTQAEVDEINSYPEFETLRKIVTVARKNNGMHKSWPGFHLKTRGGLELSSNPTRYSIVLTKNGTLMYGSYPVGPSTVFRIRNWHHLIDFISLYIISKTSGRINISQIDRFVFDGKPLAPSTLKNLKDHGYVQIIGEIAKRYNDPEVVDASLSAVDKKASSYISDIDLIEKTPAFQWFDSVFGLVKDSQEDDQKNCLNLRTKFRSPYAMFDKITGRSSYPYYVNICLGPTGTIRVKTIKGLEDAVKKYLKELVHIGYTLSDPIDQLNSAVVSYALSKIGEPLSKEEIIEKYRDQINSAIHNFFLRILETPSEFMKLGDLIEVSRKEFGINLGDPLTIANLIKRDLVKLSQIYDKLDPEVAEEIFKIMKTDKDTMESIKVLVNMGLANPNI